MSHPPRVECQNLTKRLPSGDGWLTILDTIDLSIDRGEFVAILGPSGSGKSTLLGLVAGLDRPTAGSVRIDGEALETQTEDQLAVLRRQKIGFVFQSFQLLSNLTAAENIALPLELTGVNGAGERARALLDRVGLTDRGHHYPSQLSGGEQQRVAVARAFSNRPEILLADEPTGSLDRDTGLRVLDLIVEMRQREGTTMVLVTHDLEVAGRAQRGVHLDGGRIVRDSTSPPVAGP